MGSTSATVHDRRAVILSCVLLCGAASAAEVQHQAAPAALLFEHQRQAFPEYRLDTGWVPNSGAIQVRVLGDLGGGFKTTAPGLARLGWNPDRALWAEGDPMAGVLAMNVGLELQAFLRIDIKVPGGPHYQWEGPIPGVPEFDYRFADVGNFTPFLLEAQTPSGILVRDELPPKRLLSVPLTQAIIPIPGVGGYFDLDVGGTLQAALQGEQVWFEEGSQTHHDVAVPWLLPEGSERTSRARWDAQATYGGVVDLVPAVTIKIAGITWQLAKLHVPVNLPEQDERWRFNTEEIAFALPRASVEAVDGASVLLPENRVLAIDFGDDLVGRGTTRVVRVRNDGLAPLKGTLAVSGTGFRIVTPEALDLGPGEAQDISLEMSREGDGTFVGTAVLETNDPWGSIELALTGAAHVDAQPAGEDEDLEAGRLRPGCGCSGGFGTQALPGLALLVLVGLRRSARRSRVPRAGPPERPPRSDSARTDPCS